MMSGTVEDYMRSINQYMEDFQEEHLPEWGSSKQPYFMANEEPLGLMTYHDLDVDARAWDHLRRSALTAPTGYGTPDDEKPVINWANHFYEPDEWETIREIHGVGDEHERYVLRMTLPARANMKSRFKQHLSRDDETVVVNPFDLMDLFADKYESAKYLEQEDLPAIPSLKGEEVLSASRREVELELGDGGEHGFVVKPYNGFGGKGVVGVNSISEAEAYLRSESVDFNGEERKAKDVCMVQPKIPHKSDLRVITIGDHIRNAERRIAPEGRLCTNISSIDGVVSPHDLRHFGLDAGTGRDLGVYGNAFNARKQGFVVPIDVDQYSMSRTRDRNAAVLSSGAEQLAYDTMETFDPDTFNYRADLSQRPFIIGMDFLETEMEQLDHLPAGAQDAIAEYSSDGTAYVIPELNGNPGSMADIIARWDHTPAQPLGHQITAFHLVNVMRDLAGIDTEPVEDIYGDESDRLWRRVDSYYPDLGPGFVDAISSNLKPENRR